ncbi:MAG TPA: hypothetical protein VGN90_17865 [Pyrinomonadaceae bacterium]|nr:hypothetical protein [Pyrinomonadaceae bacterium]
MTRPGVPWNGEKPDYLAAPDTRVTMLRRWREFTSVCPADVRQQATAWSLKFQTLRRETDLEVGE